MSVEPIVKALLKVYKLADELTTAIDLLSEDIGGSRDPSEILRELGPACDEVKNIGLEKALADKRADDHARFLETVAQYPCR